MSRLPALLLWLPLSLGTAFAQRVYWEPGAGSLAFNQMSQLQLVFENCEPDGAPKLPAVEGLEIQYTGSGSSFAMENMNVTRKQILSYAVRPTKRPEVSIPAFTVETNKGPQPVAAATFAIGNATVGRSAIPLETAAKSLLAPASGAYWAGEVFPVTYTLDIAQRFRPRQPGPITWTPTPLTVEDWGQPERFDSTANGEPRVGLIYRTRGYLSAPGTYKIPAASQEIVLVIDTGSSLFAFPFSSPEMVQHTVVSNEPAFTIKPLPDGAPADFGGAVGQFTLTAKVVPVTVAVGEPITWTLQLTGTGNWPDIRALPAREVSKDFKVLQPQAKRTPAEGKLFNATLSEDVVLIPTKPGAYTLDPVSYSYFDPRSGTYQTIKTTGARVTVNPLSSSELAAQPLLAPPAAAGAAPPLTATAATRVPQLPAPPPAPAAIPRDPLPGSNLGQAPFALGALSAWLLGSVIWLVPAWLLLAAARARQTDPLRARRLARSRLIQALSYLRGNSDPAARLQALHAWQYDTAILLGIEHAAPSPPLVERSDLPASVAENPKLKFQNLRAWATLWAEADRALYGRDPALPDTWLLRAQAALETTRLPDWQASSLFQPDNLLPWFSRPANEQTKPAAGKVISTIVVLLLLALVLHPASAIAATAGNPESGALTYYPTPLAAYKAGDFAAAEQAWRAALARQPADWIARHNLALALAQQGHWPEAAAHWTSAFLLNPRNESVRWHLGLGYERAGYTPPDLGDFAAASGPHLVARLASPAEWQWLLVAAGGGLATGLLLLLLRAYRSPARWMRTAGLTVVAAALLLALVALISLRFYGDAVDPHAALAWHQVLLRSIPTEADTQQKTSSLPAGSLAVVDRTFLGWVRLAFPNGQTGWVRQEDIVRLYR